MAREDARKLTPAEVRAWLKGGARRTGPHVFTCKILHWPYCARCGLVLLKNDSTRKQAKAPCVWEE